MSGYKGCSNNALRSKSFVFGGCEIHRKTKNPFEALSDEDIIKPIYELYPNTGVLTGNTKWAAAQLIEIAKRCKYVRVKIMQFMFGDDYKGRWNRIRNIERRLLDMGIALS